MPREGGDMTTGPDLSVVIPVHNAESTIGAVVDQLVSVPQISSQIVLVDDYSTDASADEIRRLADAYSTVTAIMHPSGLGAGVARNTGFERATGRYTLFFDADDVAHTDAVGLAIAHLDRSGADVAVMPYRYRRGEVVAHEAMNDPDIKIWDTVLGSAPERAARLSEVAPLLGFSNYPWNKVLRTDRYRQTGLHFSPTPVHNDILGHWHSLLYARRILLLNQVICTHIVVGSGRNLSNKQSRARLSLFDALNETYDLLERDPHHRHRYAHHYWAFVLRTAAWAAARLAPEYRDEFNSRLQDHLLRIDIGDFARIRTRHDPVLADMIVKKSIY
jgi:glycosyltransferase involved in cell wall biosynthesis